MELTKSKTWTYFELINRDVNGRMIPMQWSIADALTWYLRTRVNEAGEWMGGEA